MIREIEMAGHYAADKIFGAHIEKSVLYNFNLPVKEWVMHISKSFTDVVTRKQMKAI